MNNFIKYSSAGFKMIVIIVGMTLAGRYLDERVATSRPYFTMVFVIAGVAIAMYSVIKDITKDDKKREGEKKE